LLHGDRANSRQWLCFASCDEHGRIPNAEDIRVARDGAILLDTQTTLAIGVEA
jgi:hypothetical protein